MFTSDRYSIKWQFFSFTNKYRVYENHELVLRLEYEQGGIPAGVRLVDAAGETAFRIRTDRVIVEPTFTIVDESVGRPLGSVRRRTEAGSGRRWRFSAPDGSLVARVRRRTRLPGPIRRLFTGFAMFSPPSYDIVAPGGTRLGTIDGRFKLRDPDISAEKERFVTVPGMDAGYTYDVDLGNDDENGLDPRLAVLGTIAIDVIDAAGTSR